MCFPHLSWPRASSLKLWLQLFFRKFPSFLRAAGLWKSILAGITLFAQKTMEIGSFPQKWMWRPYMVDLCSIAFDASRRPLQFICGSQTPSQCSFDARVDKPPKRSKMGGFPQKFHRSTEKSQIPELPRYRFRDIRYESFKKDVFLGLFPMYLQADEHGDFCAIFEWQFGAPNDVETWNRPN